MRLILFFSLLNVFTLKSQQTTNYIQYAFNKAGASPAASGTNINQKITYIFGANRQWLDYDRAPKSTFVNFSYTLRPPRSYSYWQNVGAYVERDQSGLISNNSFYASYTIHLLLRKNLVTSFGVFAGFRKFFLSPGIIDPNDPISNKVTSSLYTYPDLIPGIRLSNNKFFFDVSARQVSVQHQEDFKGRKLGGPSYLNPTIFVTYGKFIPVNDYFLAMPSVAVNMAILSAPSINAGLMMYYGNRFGFGASCRNFSFINAIVQFKIFQNLSVGMAYSYTTNKSNVAAPHSYEIMMGVTPMGLDMKYHGKRSIARCPTLEF